MRGRGTSIGHSQPRTCSGRKTLKRCKNNREVDNVVLIDVDSDNFNNVIIIDVPEPLPQKVRGSSVLRKDKNGSLRTIICIDDDESVDNHPGIDVEGGGNFYSDGSSSRRSWPASNHSQNSVDAVGDECQSVQENISPVKLSKCKRTYSGKAYTRNRYGLSPESESASSDDDCSECEFMEGAFGKLREQWEQASLRRKYDVRNGQFGTGDQATASRFHTDTHQNVEVENMTEQRANAPVCSNSSNAIHEKENPGLTEQGSFRKLGERRERTFLKRKYDVCSGQSGRGDQASASMFHTDTHQNEMENMTAQCKKAPVCSSSSYANYDKENLSPSIATGDSNLGCTSSNPKKTPFADFDLKSTDKTQVSHSKADVQDRGEPSIADPPFNSAKWQTHKHVEHGRSSFCNEKEQSSEGPSLCQSEVSHAKKFSQDKEKTPPAEPCLFNSEPSFDINLGQSEATLPDEEASLRKSQHSVETVVDHGRVVFRNKGENFQQIPSSYCSHFSKELKQESNSFVDKDKSVSGEPLFRNTQSSDETQVNRGVAPDDEVGPSLCKSGISDEKGGCQEKGKSVPEEPFFCNIHCNEAQTKQGKSCSVEAKEIFVEPMSNSQQLNERENPLHAQDGDVMLTVQSCIINDREKLKETDEYKRAVEEEWASRQRELQIQAEEAQQLRLLRKRRKAESMRLLDMERRQKQRVEEMRESQKKDEENMNLKDQLRAEVRKELNKLEMTCHDMASLLRGLGIRVGGGLHPLSPLSDEVRAAYKRALLSFHPDRASRSDIRQLVEAEEKFKLISRMKEKFLLAS